MRSGSRSGMRGLNAALFSKLVTLMGCRRPCDLPVPQRTDTYRLDPAVRVAIT